MNSYLLKTLRAYIAKDQSNWPSLLPSVMFAYRTSVCTQSTDYTPYFLVFGKECLTPLDTALLPSGQMGLNAQVHLENFIKNLQIAREIAQNNIREQQIKYKARYDQGTAESVYKVGDKVWLTVMHKTPGLSPKLQPKQTGPYWGPYRGFT